MTRDLSHKASTLAFGFASTAYARCRTGHWLASRLVLELVSIAASRATISRLALAALLTKHSDDNNAHATAAAAAASQRHAGRLVPATAAAATTGSSTARRPIEDMEAWTLSTTTAARDDPVKKRASTSFIAYDYFDADYVLTAPTSGASKRDRLITKAVPR